MTFSHAKDVHSAIVGTHYNSWHLLKVLGCDEFFLATWRDRKGKNNPPSCSSLPHMGGLAFMLDVSVPKV